ncbi:hypothetical protein L950_0217045 [Sphingobacterium sp. IITKGP-BTPF85]|nr:hypothetical protein L950_0217045 [Sphingobacterium sp. IITKGP-BTPF85]
MTHPSLAPDNNAKTVSAAKENTDKNTAGDEKAEPTK